MTIEFVCPRCALRHSREDHESGVKFQCSCGQRLRVPDCPHSATAAPIISSAASRNDPYRRLLIIGFAVAVLLLGAVAVVVYHPAIRAKLHEEKVVAEGTPAPPEKSEPRAKFVPAVVPVAGVEPDKAAGNARPLDRPPEKEAEAKGPPAGYPPPTLLYQGLNAKEWYEKAKNTDSRNYFAHVEALNSLGVQGVPFLLLLVREGLAADVGRGFGRNRFGLRYTVERLDFRLVNDKDLPQLIPLLDDENCQTTTLSKVRQLRGRGRVFLPKLKEKQNAAKGTPQWDVYAQVIEAIGGER